MVFDHSKHLIMDEFEIIERINNSKGEFLDHYKTLHQMYLEQFNFLVETLATVGYGNNISDFNHSKSETLLLICIILIGTLLFSKFASGIDHVFTFKYQKISI